MDITGIKDLTLITTDGGNGIRLDHGIFANNYLIDSTGSKTKLKLSKAVKIKPGYGKARQDKFSEKRALSIGGKTYSNGIVLHANGTVTFSINGKYKSFISFAGCFDKSNGSVRFKVLGDG